MSKCASQWSESIQINSSPSYVSSLATPCSAIQSRPALWSSSQADFIVTWSLRKPCTCISCTRLNRTSCRTSLANLHRYRFVKLTSRHTFSLFIMTRLSSVMRSINDNLITIIKIIKMHVVNSRATTLISKMLNGVRKSAYFHYDFQSKF